ncbi:MAG: NUDIX hydrolase [Bacteroidales bacterium]
MVKEYKIYLNSRKIILSPKFSTYFKKSIGLFVGYNHPDELPKLLTFFQSTSNVDNLYIIGNDIEALFTEFKKNFLIIEAAGGLVINSNNKILLIKRNGKWDLPKGKVDDGENSEQAAVREVMEECGITNIKITNPLTTTFHTYALKDKLVLKPTKWYSMRFDRQTHPKPQTEEGITEVCWVKPNDLSNYLNNTYSSIKDVFYRSGLYKG